MRTLLLFLLMWASCEARVVPVESMEKLMDLFKGCEATTLAVFDIDMTLIQPEDPAFQMVNIFKHGHVAKRVINNLPKEKRDIFFSLTTLGSHSVLIDEKTPEYLHDLRNRNIPSIALTAALTGPLCDIKAMEEWKRGELFSFDIDFSSSFPHLQRLKLYEMPNYRGNHAMFFEGIVFTNSSSCAKGDALVTFLIINDLHPKQVVFADDKEEHVKNVEAALFAYDPTIEYTGAYFLGAMQYPTPEMSEEEFSNRWEEVAAHAVTIN